MTVGTRSILFGVHNIFIHALAVGMAWWKLYGAPLDPRLWIAFLAHDIGYLGKGSMEGPIGETQVELGVRIMQALFGPSWGDFCRRHSRYYARSRGLPISRLCVADKLAFVLTPDWLYLPLARASGELTEYMSRARKRQAGNDHFTPEEAAQLNSANAKVWLQGLKSYTLRWVMEHRAGCEDTWTTVDAHDVIGAVKNDERGLRDSTQSLPEERAVPVADPIEIELFRLLRIRFSPLARFGGPLLAGWYNRGDARGNFYLTQVSTWLWIADHDESIVLTATEVLLSDEQIAATLKPGEVLDGLLRSSNSMFNSFQEHLTRVGGKEAAAADLGVYLTDDCALVVDAVALRRFPSE